MEAQLDTAMVSVSPSMTILSVFTLTSCDQLRCPGLRIIISDFWNQGGGTLELSIDASDETRQAALQWLLTQHHDEASMLVCDFRVESMCFRVDCFLAFSFVQSTFIRFVRFEM
jgi:hypothetical protein